MQLKQLGFVCLSFWNVCVQAVPGDCPWQALASTAKSWLEQVVDSTGGVVTLPGLQPAYAEGQRDPLLQTRFWQSPNLLKQLSQSAPYWPQFVDEVPGRHSPVEVQQPAQLSGPQCVPE